MNARLQADLDESENVVKPAVRGKSITWSALQNLGSLKLTVVLFLFSIVLVFFGTWAQKENDIWTVVTLYFRSFLVLIPLRVLTLDWVGPANNISIPYPGGWLLGTLLMANLLAAHFTRFRVSWKRTGILMIHGGLILMMLGELITGLFAVEGRMTVAEGNYSNFVELERYPEFAIVDRSNPKEDHEILIPGNILEKKGLISDPKLPFDVEVLEYMHNSDIRLAHEGKEFPGGVGIATRKAAVERSKTAGVDSEQKIEIPSAYVRLKKKGSGEDLGTYLTSTWFTVLHRPAEEVEIDGKKYQISLRYQRSYRPYTVYLKEFRHDVYPGTTIPKNYSSLIRLVDEASAEDREIKISMNNPLRYHGETFFQSGLHPLAKGTVLQVVRNPGWLMPYISCVVVTLGLMIHFGLHLAEFLRRRAQV